MPAAPTGSTARIEEYRRHSSSVAVRGLKRIKARTKLTEILYIFFGIHTANAVQLVRREVNEIAQTA